MMLKLMEKREIFTYMMMSRDKVDVPQYSRLKKYSINIFSSYFKNILELMCLLFGHKYYINFIGDRVLYLHITLEKQVLPNYIEILFL